MNLIITAVLMFSLNQVRGQYNIITSTTRAYDVQVPESTRIRIIESDPTRELRPGEWTTERNKRGVETNEKEEPPVNLKEFLESYAENIRRKSNSRTPIENLDKIDLITKPTEDVPNSLSSVYSNDKDKSKSWNLLNTEQHHNPYDDKNGWVSLDAVPWSVSKISKWQSKQQAILNTKPWQNEEYNPYHSIPKPTWNHKPHIPNSNYQTNDDFYMKPINLGYNGNYDSKPDPRPVYPRPPQYTYQQPSTNHGTDLARPPWKKQPIHKYGDDCDRSPGTIITDGLPPNFPHFHEETRRRGSEIHSESHPFSGDVLPPLKDSNVNMTTSHGGLLQVESSFQTVDQSHRIYMKKQKERLTAKRRPKPAKQTAPLKTPQTTTITTRKNTHDASAVLAAVGAGMIPATMAMLVPMTMGRRRRRDVKFVTSDPNSDEIEITLPRSF